MLRIESSVTFTAWADLFDTSLLASFLVNLESIALYLRQELILSLVCQGYSGTYSRSMKGAIHSRIVLRERPVNKDY